MTPQAALAAQIERYRQMTGEQRWDLAFELHEFACDMARAGMALLEPGASPHPPHRHPEEEFLIVAQGTGEIECDGKVTQVGPGAMLEMAYRSTNC